MVGFIWSAAILAVLLQLIYDQHKVKAEQRRKEHLISSFIDKAVAENCLYPIGHHWEQSPYGFFPGSSSVAAKELFMSENEAYVLMSRELERRGMPTDRSA